MPYRRGQHQRAVKRAYEAGQTDAELGLDALRTFDDLLKEYRSGTLVRAYRNGARDHRDLARMLRHG